MKIAIISNVDYRHMSLISMYTEFFEKNNIEFDIINATEFNETESNNNIFNSRNNYVYHHSKLRLINRVFNLINNINYKRFVKNILKKNNYDYLIIWRSEVGFLFKDELIKNYKNKYIFNIRDYAGENNKRKFEYQRSLVSNSLMNVISSKGFLTFLPEENYFFRHSINNELVNSIKKIEAANFSNDPIKVGFIGNVRFYQEDIKLLEALKNDKRFVVQYFGTGSKKLKDYAENNKILNCEFIEKFRIEETSQLLSKIDIINNIFGGKDISVSTLTSIRYYNSLLSKRPFIANENTFMGKLTENNRIGFNFNGDYSKLGDDLYNWYRELNFKEYEENVEKKLINIYKENYEFEEQLKKNFL